MALKKVKYLSNNNMIHTFLFMLTKELKLHILHFNKSELEIISTYKIDMHLMGGAGGRQLKEVLYTTYDRAKMTIVVVFA